MQVTVYVKNKVIWDEVKAKAKELDISVSAYIILLHNAYVRKEK